MFRFPYSNLLVMILFVFNSALAPVMSPTVAPLEAASVNTVVQPGQVPTGLSEADWNSIQNQIQQTMGDDEAAYPSAIDSLITNELKKLVVSDGTTNDLLGYSIATDGDTVVVGSLLADVGSNANQGAAYVFTRNTGGADQWNQVKKLTASDGLAEDRFGWSAAISGDTIVIGARLADVSGRIDQGAAYVFKRNQGGIDQWGQVRKLTASDGIAMDCYGISVAIEGDKIVVGAHGAVIGGNDNQGAAYVYYRNQGGVEAWGQVRKIIASDGTLGDEFGESVSISGDMIVVGAWWDDVGSNTHQGSAYVYYRNQGGADLWGQVRKLTASDGAAYDDFGVTVSLDGDTLVVGAPGADVNGNTNQGAAYVFTRNQGGSDLWGQVTKLTAPDGAANDEYGFEVSISGKTIAIGAYRADIEGLADQGRVYIHERNQGGGDQWGYVAQIAASDGATGDLFGYAVSIRENTITIGAQTADLGGNTDQGAAYTFVRNGNAWEEVANPIASDGAANDHFGFEVSVSNDTVLVGARFDDVGGTGVDQGSAYIFTRNQDGMDGWGQVLRITASDGTASDNFGASVTLDGDIAVVGAIGDNTGQGAAYVFYRNQGGANQWGQVQKITASDGATNDRFGLPVSLQGDILVVGAYTADVGANVDQGAAYVFYRNQGGADMWGQVRKLTSSDGVTSDYFGHGIGISENGIIVVGAYYADINGKAGQGAAYVFYRNQGGPDMWGQVTKLVATDGAASDCFGYAVAASKDMVIIGSYLANVNGVSDQGAAYIFERNWGGVAESWGQVAKLSASDGAENDLFGHGVDGNEDIVIVGSPRVDDVNPGNGAVYTFSRNQGGANSWGQTEKITASNGMLDDYFGKSVSYDDHSIAVGASYADVNGNTDQGAAYIYSLNASPDLSVSKDVTPTFVDYHGVVTYTVTVSNSGLVDEPNVLFTDTLPAEVDFGTWIVQPAGATENSDVITWTGPISVGQVITLSFTAVHVGDWGDVVTNTATAGNISDTAIFTVEPGYSLTVALAGTGSGEVASTPPGIACGPDCIESYVDGTDVTLTATPAITSTFTGWSGACTGLGACAVTMTETKHVTATFTLTTPGTFDLTVSKDGNGTVTSNPAGINCGSDCSEAYDDGTVVALMATPAISSTFTGWSGDCTGLGTCAVTMTETKRVTATFTLATPGTFELTVGKDGNGSGTVTSNPAGIACGGDCSEMYDDGTVVNLTAAPAISSTFAGWSGDCTGLGACAVTMTAARHVTATFTITSGTFELTVGKDGNGDGTVTSNPAGIACGSDCSEMYNYGTVVNLTADPTFPSAFTGWSGACTGTGTCTVAMTEARHVTATFESSLLYGDFQAVKAGLHITFTVVVTSPTPQSNVIVTGSIPANTVFASVTGGSWVPTGGDYSNGYVSSGVVPSLLPGERITLTWTVYVPFYALGYIENQAHARADTASNVLHLWHRYYRMMLPLVYKDTVAYP